MPGDRSIYVGLPRAEIDWFPRIDQDKCRPEECGFRCVKYCPFHVFAMEGERAVVARPYECNVPDESCRFQCPVGAISFPTREELKEMLRALRAKMSAQA
jgi:NAD-dependent dihydropyrimidine dehydrogenase PreA subunit